MDNRTRALIRASGFYLTTPITQELLDGDVEVLDTFLEDNAWEPFEGWTAEVIFEYIYQLADSFEELMV